MTKIKHLLFPVLLILHLTGFIQGQVSVQFPSTTSSYGGCNLTLACSMTYGSSVGLYSSANLSSYWGYITSIKWKGYGDVAYNITAINAYLANTTNSSMINGLNESYYRTTNGSVVTNPVQIASNASLALATTGTWLGFTGLSYLLNSGQNLYVTFHCNSSSSNYCYFAGTGTALYGSWGAMSNTSNPSINVPPQNNGNRPDITVVFGAPTISLPSTASMTCNGSTGIAVSSSTLSTSYQWQYCSTPGGSYINVSDGTPAGAVYTNITTNTLGISGISAAGNYYYKCVAYNGNAASTTSATYTTLAVSCCTPPASVVLSGYTTPICSGINPGTFTANASGGSGGSYTYQWYKNGISTGVTTPIYVAGSLTSNTDIYCAVSTGSGCTTNSGTTTILVNSSPASVSVSADQNNVCSGTTVNFTASPVNGGTPTYQWFVNGSVAGINSATYSYTPVNGDQVHVIMTSTANCVTGSPATSNTITMATLPNLPAGVSIGVSQNNICSGIAVNFTATPGNGGTPTYQWFVNGSVAGTNSATYSYTPVNGDQVHVIMTSTANCVTGSPATSNTVLMTILPNLPAGVSIGVDQNNICSGIAVNFNATPGNGGTPTYQWFVNGSAAGTNSSTYSYTPANGDQVHVVMTSSLSCASGNPATSNTITMATLPNLPAGVSIGVDQNNICAGATVHFTATPGNGGTPTYQWFVNGSAAGTNSSTYSYIPASGDLVHVVMTSTLSCVTGNPATSNTTTMITLPNLPASISIEVDQNNMCSGIPANFTATPVNGGTPTYQWYVNGTMASSNSAVYSYSPADGDQVNVVMTSALICATGNPASSNTVTMAVLAVLPASVSIDVNQNNVCTGTTVSFIAASINGGTPVYQWYVNSAMAGTGQPTYSYIPANGDQVHVTMTSSLACVSGSPATSAGITMNVHTCTGIETLVPGISALIIYPNPIKDKLFVNFEQLSVVPKTLRIVNSLGQLCYETNQPMEASFSGIQVSNLKPGIYSLHISFENGIVNKSFIVQ